MSKFTLRPAKSPENPHRNKFLIGGVIITCFVIGAIVWLLWFKETKSVIPSTNPTSNQIDTPTTSTPTPSDKTPGGPGTNPLPSDSTDTPSDGTSLKAPSGSFVSNHTPSLSGADTPSQVQSVCNTSVGAQCEIIFKKGTEAKSLGKQTTDGEGNAYWNWDVKMAGLSVGTWTITATATRGSETQSTNDQINLEVQP